MTIRRYRPDDFDAVNLICRVTADAGAPMTGLPHPELLGHVFVAPYVTLDPDFAFVHEDSEGVAGYVVAASDTEEFYRRWRVEWAPRFLEAHPPPSVSAEPEADAWLRRLLHDPVTDVPHILAEYPAHLHIDLLARARGGGHGRELLGALFDTLRANNIPGVHLLVPAANANGIAFYQAMGFTELPSPLPALRLFVMALNG